jgi:hypothetical protein
MKVGDIISRKNSPVQYEIVEDNPKWGCFEAKICSNHIPIKGNVVVFKDDKSWEVLNERGRLNPQQIIPKH